jgi:hypothetical protein
MRIVVLRPEPTSRNIRSAGSLVLLFAAICSAYTVPGSMARHAVSRTLLAAGKSAESKAAKAKVLLSRLAVERRHGVQSELRALLEDLLAAAPSTTPAPRISQAGTVTARSIAPPPQAPKGNALFQRPPPAISPV